MAFEKLEGGEEKGSPERFRGLRRKAERNNHEDLGFEAKMWKAADKLHSNIDVAEYIRRDV